MKKIFRTSLIIILLHVMSGTVFPATLEWDIPKNRRLEVVRNATIEYLNNKITVKIFKERNIINLSCYKKKDNSSFVKGLFSVYQKERGNNVYVLREQYKSDFSIANNGKYSVSDKMYMPNFRHVPSFPVKSVLVGESWTAPAEMIINSFSRPLKISFEARYTLKKIEKMKDNDIAIINYTYVMDKKLINGQHPEDFPLRIVGKNEGVIKWNISKKEPAAGKDWYRIVFLFNREFGSIATSEFRMNIETHYKMYEKVSKKQREKIRDDLRKKLPGDIKIETDKRGIVLRLGEVFFDFDSHSLKGATQKTLERVSEILKKKYGDREIVVEGHTDKIGDRVYNRTLSKNRAYSVAKYLKSRIDNDKISYRGLGEDKPIADNATKEGRQKNRRVEIIIKLN